MDDQTRLKIISNDLDSLFARVESMRPHPMLTNAGSSILQAKTEVEAAARQILKEKTTARDNPEKGHALK